MSLSNYLSKVCQLFFLRKKPLLKKGSFFAFGKKLCIYIIAPLIGVLFGGFLLSPSPIRGLAPRQAFKQNCVSVFPRSVFDKTFSKSFVKLFAKQKSLFIYLFIYVCMYALSIFIIISGRNGGIGN
jgi:hypothetical protein